MDALSREFDFLAASVERAIRLQRQVPQLHLDRGSRGGTTLARHLVALYDGIARHVERRRKQFSSAPDDMTKRGAITEMRELIVSARGLQSNMAWIDAAADPPLDLGTTYFVEAVARQLVQPSAELVVVASHELSYATSSNPFDDAIRAFGAVPPAGDTAIVVFIPRREKDSGLLHPLIVHELGHAVVAEHQLVKAVLSAAGKRKRLNTRLTNTASAVAKSQGITDAEATNAIVERLATWIEELLCDSIAVHYLGPTYLYSFLAEVTAGNVDAAGRKHPPPRQRVRLLLDQLDRSGWKDTLTSAGSELDTWTRSLAKGSVAYSGIDEFLVWSAEALAPDVRNLVSRQLKGHALSPDPAELIEIDGLLRAGVPPAQAENGDALARPSIILGCWLFALRAAGGDAPALATAADAEELARLLPKGLEMSAIVEAWSG